MCFRSNFNFDLMKITVENKLLIVMLASRSHKFHVILVFKVQIRTSFMKSRTEILVVRLARWVQKSVSDLCRRFESIFQF